MQPNTADKGEKGKGKGKGWGLPRALIPIYGIVFLDVLGFTILIPLLPDLAKRYHTGPAMIATLLSVTAIFAALSSPVWGRLSDKLGRKEVLQFSQGFSFVGYALLALAPELAWLFASRVIEGLGGGNIGVATSYMADVTSDDQREKAFAYGAAAFGTGFVIGPAIAGQMLRVSPTAPFWLAAGTQALMLVLTALFLPKTGAKAAAKADIGKILGELKRPAMLNLMGRQFLYIFAFVYFFTVFSLYLEVRLHFAPQDSSLLLALAGGIGALIQVFAVDRLNRRFGEKVLSQAGFAVGFIAYVAMTWVNSLAYFIGIEIVWAASGSVLRPTLNKLVAGEASEEHRGAILGFADSLNNGAEIFAPAAAGAILGVGSQYVGILPAIAVALAFVLGMFGTSQGKVSEEDRKQQTSAVA